MQTTPHQPTCRHKLKLGEGRVVGPQAAAGLVQLAHGNQYCLIVVMGWELQNITLQFSVAGFNLGSWSLATDCREANFTQATRAASEASRLQAAWQRVRAHACIGKTVP